MGCLSRRRGQLHGVADAYFTLRQHPSVNPAPSGVPFLRDPHEPAVQKRVPDRFAGVGEAGYLDENGVAEPDSGTGPDQIPIDSFRRHVLARRSDPNRMALGLQGFDSLEGIHTNGAFGSAVVLSIVLRVSLEPRS